jgi:Asp-tRNA(Asn)/Glu-tRNA(Gln) amidotransferase A subunit family amidase
VYDAAVALEVMAGPDPADPATAGAPSEPDYTSGLTESGLAGLKIAVLSAAEPPAYFAPAVAKLQELGATTVPFTMPAATTVPSIVLRELKRDLDAYLPTMKGKAAKSLLEIVDYNIANPVEGLKYLQRDLLTAVAVDLADPATLAAYEADKAAGIAATQTIIDGILSAGTADPADDFDLIVVPQGALGDPMISAADRAGYPILTVPAAYGTGGSGRNPIGLTFVGAAFDEATLLAAGYAFEQGTAIRLAPSFTNPSMWRCVPGSDFFSPHHCHPGDLLASS